MMTPSLEATPDTLLETYARSQEMRHCRIEVERGGQTLTLEYFIE